MRTHLLIPISWHCPAVLGGSNILLLILIIIIITTFFFILVSKTPQICHATRRHKCFTISNKPRPSRRWWRTCRSCRASVPPPFVGQSPPWCSRHRSSLRIGRVGKPRQMAIGELWWTMVNYGELWWTMVNYGELWWTMVNLVHPKNGDIGYSWLLVGCSRRKWTKSGSLIRVLWPEISLRLKRKDWDWKVLGLYTHIYIYIQNSQKSWDWKHQPVEIAASHQPRIRWDPRRGVGRRRRFPGSETFGNIWWVDQNTQSPNCGCQVGCSILKKATVEKLETWKICRKHHL